MISPPSGLAALDRTATVAADYEAGKSMLNLDLGYEPQVLEFADIKLLHFGRTVKESDLPRSGI